MSMNSTKNRIQKYEKAFGQSLCEQYIKDALDKMSEDEFDFLYSSDQPFRKGRKKQMLRNGIYLRFNCLKCDQKQKKRRFTSTMGTVSIKFQLTKLNQKRRDPWLLIFKLKIYRMKCLQCGIYGVPQIYDSQLIRIENQFVQIVADILNKVPPKPRKQNGKQPDLKHHRHNQCQACREKKCHSGQCPALH